MNRMGVRTNPASSRLVAYVLMIVLLMVSMSLISSFAEAARGDKKGGGGGGGGGGSDGGSSCTDVFPSFTYTREGKRNSSFEALYLSSSEGCRSLKLADIDPHADSPKFSYNNGQGLIAWIGGDDLNLYVLRFSVDDAGAVTAGNPELALATKQPSAGDPSEEYFFGLDVRADYSTGTAIEQAVLYSSIAADPSQGAQQHQLLLLDLVACTSESGSCSSPLTDTTIDESLACMGDGPFNPFDSLDGWMCLVPNGDPTFDSTGSYVYYRIDAPGSGPNGDWAGIARSNVTTSDFEQELIFVSASSNSTPPRGYVAELDLEDDEINARVPVMAAHACIGSSGGFNDCQLYFLNIDVCMDDPGANWLDCTVLYSGAVPGFDPSWRTAANGRFDVVYLGWGARDFDTIRVLSPEAIPSNDRQVISNGERPDSGG